jgi:uncharacterized membrane protein
VSPDMLTRPGFAKRQLMVLVGAGLVAAIGLSAVVPPLFAVLAGWDVGAGSYLLWIWRASWRLGADETARIAGREEPARGVRDALLLVSGVASLAAIPAVLVTTHRWQGLAQDGGFTVAVATVVISWLVIHTVFATRYVRLYYDQGGGIDFHQSDPPSFRDFAYVAFTIGTTFQVSDTDLTCSRMRMVAMQHQLLSFLFGTVLIAAFVNLIAGLAR